MPDKLLRAQLYRDHARRLRTMGRGWAKSGSLQQLQDLACDYEKMAEELERSAKTKTKDPDR